MNNILVPVDFSDRSDFSLETIRPLARTGSEVSLLHVVETVRSTPFLATGEYIPVSDEENHFNMELVRKGKVTLHDLVDRLSSRSGNGHIRFKGALRVGGVFDAIMDYIKEATPDLLVMGAHQNPEHVYPLAGSLNDRILRQAPCPVLTVRDRPEDGGFRSIVYATAMDEDEMALARVIQQLATQFDSVVHVVRINTPSDFQRDRPVIDFMRDFSDRIGFRNCTLNTYNDVTVEDGILEFAGSVKADLIAMATHGRRGLARAISGSITEDVAAQSRLPILTQVVGH